MLLLNADVGEGISNDEELIPFLKFANIACGGHAGSEQTIIVSIKLAKKYRVKVGAHPSYADKDNFGRVSLDYSIPDLEKLLKNQIDFFLKQAILLGVNMHHVKLHGALYNDVFSNKKTTIWFLNWVNKNYPLTKVFVPLPASDYIPDYLTNEVLIEAFADRNYEDNLQLIPRKQSNACIDNIVELERHVKNIQNNKLITLSGKVFKIKADTLCLHGDHPKVLEYAKLVSRSL